jgi:diguanylate cyclase (GGDEF)-like protein
MALQAAPVDSRRYRRPWYWLVVLFVVASTATIFVVANAQSRIDQNDAQFDVNQTLRLQSMEQSIAEYLGDSTQLTKAGALMLAQPGESRDLVHRLVFSLYGARRSDSIYGLGVFYEPYALDPRVEFLSFYDHSSAPLPPGAGAIDSRGPFDHTLPGGVHEVAYVSSGDKTPFDVRKRVWYKQAAASPDQVVVFGPYQDSLRSFISTLKAIVRDDKVIGVVSVDTLTYYFKELMLAHLATGDVAYVEDGTGRWLLGTAPFPGVSPALLDRGMPLRYTPWRVHLIADTHALRIDDRQTTFDSVVQVAGVWIAAAMFGFGLLRNWRSHEARLALEAEQVRLENELDVRKKVEVELRKAAYTDTLTGLPNRTALLETISAVIAMTAGEPTHAVFFIDLDRFNMINDTLGHLAGDDLIKMIATRLRDSLPPTAMIARLGGDEFVVCAAVDQELAGAFAARILGFLREPMLLGGRVCYTAASIGIVIVDSTYRGPEDVLRDADIAMYTAKDRGRARSVIFDTAMRRKVATESDLENALRRAIERHEFVPYYQPIVSIATREVTSFEALVRWNRPGAGIVAASDFISYAEARGLVDAIDAKVFADVCTDAALLFAQFPQATVAVNISAGHLNTPGLAASIDSTLRAHALAPERIKLEITETAIMTNAEQARATLDELRHNGIQILVDDFGAGHSSLTYLHRLPIAGLKIDRSFVSDLAAGDQPIAIVRSIVALAQTLGLYTIAEGVETAEQLSILQELGVVYAQGFFFSPALSLAALLDFSRESKSYGA